MDEVPVINIDKIEGRLLRKYDGNGFGAFGVILSKLNYVSTTDISTAATDGKNIYYNPYFMSKLTLEQQCFILGHEILHVAFNHLKRSKDRNPELWNIATDAVINAALVDDDFVLIEGAIDMQEGREMSADDIYEMLVKQKEEKQQNKQNNQGEKQNEKNNSQTGQNQPNAQQSDGSDNAESRDEQNQAEQKNCGHAPHDLWKKVFEKEENNQDKSENDGEQQENPQREQAKDGDSSINENEIVKKMRESANKAREERNNQRMQTAIDGPRAVKKTCEGVGYQKPIVPWQSILRAAVRGEQDFSYANATVEYGALRPHLKTIPKPKTQIVLDTSGSISETLLKNFLRECKNIFGKSEISAGCFDTEFYGFHEIKNLKDIDDFTIEGRGETDFDVAVNAFSPRVENHVIFTDGEAKMPKKYDRAIWVIFGDEYSEPRKIKPKGAMKVIYISREEYKKMCRQNFKEVDYEKE